MCLGLKMSIKAGQGSNTLLSNSGATKAGRAGGERGGGAINFLGMGDSGAP